MASMERSWAKGTSPSGEDDNQTDNYANKTDRPEDEEVATPQTQLPETCVDTLAARLRSGLSLLNDEKFRRWSERCNLQSAGQGELLDLETDYSSAPPSSSSPISLTDTCGRSISSLSSASSTLCFSGVSSSSSSSSSVSLSPPLPPYVDVSAVLTDTRLTLDVYQGGAAVLARLWMSIPGQLRGLQYLRLGSEDKPGLDSALDVIPSLTNLRSLTIRGTFHLIYIFSTHI